MNNLSFAFFGTTNYSKELLLFLLEKDLVPKVIYHKSLIFHIVMKKLKTQIMQN